MKVTSLARFNEFIKELDHDNKDVYLEVMNLNESIISEIENSNLVAHPKVVETANILDFKNVIRELMYSMMSLKRDQLMKDKITIKFIKGEI